MKPNPAKASFHSFVAVAFVLLLFVASKSATAQTPSPLQSFDSQNGFRGGGNERGRWRHPATTRRGDFDFIRSESVFPGTRPAANVSIAPQITTPGSRLEDWKNSENWPLEWYGQNAIDSARETASRLRFYAESMPSVVANVAIENAGFASQWAELAEDYVALAAKADELSQTLAMTTDDFNGVRQKIDAHGLTPTIGSLLRLKKGQLDRWHAERSTSILVNESLQESRDAQLALDLVRFDGLDPDDQAAQILRDFDQPSASKGQHRQELVRLLAHRHQWLEALRKGHRDYQTKLGEFDSAKTAAAELTRQYHRFIDKQVTWIRSGNPIQRSDFSRAKSGIASLINSNRGHQFGSDLQQKLRVNLASGVGLLVLVVVFLVVRWRAKSWLVGIGNRQVLRNGTDATQLMAACGLTVLVALIIPAVFFAAGRWLGSGFVSESMLEASRGLYASSLTALMVELPRQLLRDHGVIARFLAVEVPRRETACRYLMIVGTGLVLAAYVVTVTGLIDGGVWRESLSRFLLIGALLLVAWTFHRAFRPVGGYMEPLIGHFGGAVIHRVRLLIYIVMVGSPIAIAILAALGYGFTARELITRFAMTFSALLIAASLWSPLKILSAHGWRLLTGGKPPEREFDAYGEIVPEHQVDLSGGLYLDLKHHIAFLLQCGLLVAGAIALGWLWLDIFPNLKMGNPVVWSIQESVTSQVVTESGEVVSSANVLSSDVTLLHVVSAIGVIFVAFQLAKLLPALFDAIVLQRVSFDEGMEHFSLVVGRCVLFGTGCLIAANLLGLQWRTIQWLAVGLTIGLGFGLQDMVRNVFGGLIVLFEKPAGLGDRITVGKITGRVAKQHLRTTVLTDDEGRENIIPNKKFVTDDVTNWLGAGRLTVLPMEVAVTLDERPADICRKLFELVREQPQVVTMPAPQATLVCVSKHSQRIELRAWIEDGSRAMQSREKLLQLIHATLRDRKMLASDQPTQPPMLDPVIDGEPMSGMTATRKLRSRSSRRSA
ncbi:MAG: mechanosensitive ion channel domain-containing protein [Planctomycetota bacterium]